MEVGVDSKTISHWLSVLQASYLVTLLPPYYENITKRVVKSPKLYFNDPGLACYLLDIETPKQLELDKMRGAIFENMVVMECLKHRFNQGKEGNVYFYRDRNGQDPFWGCRWWWAKMCYQRNGIRPRYCLKLHLPA